MVGIKMKLIDLKKLIDNKDGGMIKVQDSITGEYYMIDSIELDVHGDLEIRIV